MENGIPITSDETKTNPIPLATGIPTATPKNNKTLAIESNSKIEPEQSNKPIIDIPSANINKTNLNQAFENLIEQAKTSNITKTNTDVSVKANTNNLTPKNFIQDILKDGLQASKETGVPPQFILGHAALLS